MKSRFIAAGLTALVTTSLSACGSAGGTNTASFTTIKLSQADYVTVAPILTSTVPPTTVVNQTSTTLSTSVAGEQEYIVVNGDYLTRIAKKYGISAQAIADYNQWTDGVNHLIYQGFSIKIPPGATIVAAGTPASATTTTSNIPIGGTYVVVDGDTLSRIAGRNGTTVKALIAVNGWTDGVNHLIYKGLKINLPVKSG